jgi:hypothetical protein
MTVRVNELLKVIFKIIYYNMYILPMMQSGGGFSNVIIVPANLQASDQVAFTGNASPAKIQDWKSNHWRSGW